MKGEHTTRVGRYVFNTPLTDNQLKREISTYKTWIVPWTHKDPLEKAIRLMYLAGAVHEVYYDGQKVQWV